MERAHRELRSRLANRLRGDYTHRFSNVDRHTASEITPVAFRTETVARLARERSAHLHFVDAGGFDRVDRLLIEKIVGLEQVLSAFRAVEIGGRHAAENALAEAFDDFAAFDQ